MKCDIDSHDFRNENCNYYKIYSFVVKRKNGE